MQVKIVFQTSIVSVRRIEGGGWRPSVLSSPQNFSGTLNMKTLKRKGCVREISVTAYTEFCRTLLLTHR